MRWRDAAIPAASLAATASVVSTRRGPGKSPDSAHYLSAAESLAADGSLTVFSGEPLTQFPPGLPIVIRALMLTGLDGGDAVRTLNVVAITMVVLLTAALLHRHVQDRALVALGSLLVAVGMPMVGIARWAWSEPMFTVVVLLSVALLDRIRRGPSDTIASTDIAGLVLLTWVAVSLRYAGLGFLPAVAGSLVVIARGRAGPWLRPASIYLAAAATVPLLWFSRNLLLVGSIGGPGSEPRDSVTRDLLQVIYTVGQTLVGRDLGAWVLGLVGLLVMLWLAWMYVKDLRSRVSTDGRVMVTDLLVVFSAGLILTLLVAARVTWVQIYWRMLAPLFPLLIIMIVISLDGTVRRSVGRGLGVGGLVAAVLLSTVAAAIGTREAAITGLGFNGTPWTASPLIAEVDGLQTSVTLVSNRADAVWAITGRRPVLRPSRPATTSVSDGADPAHESIRAAICDPDREVLLVSFGTEPWRWDRADLPAKVVESEPLVLTEDGGLFRLNSQGLPVHWCDGSTAVPRTDGTP